MDYIDVFDQVIEKSPEYNKTDYMTFIHYEKALDSVHTAAGLKALKDLANKTDVHQNFRRHI